MVEFVQGATNKKTNVSRTVEFMEFGRDRVVNAITGTWDNAVENKKICQPCLR